jgi:hypothetical protein
MMKFLCKKEILGLARKPFKKIFTTSHRLFAPRARLLSLKEILDESQREGLSRGARCTQEAATSDQAGRQCTDEGVPFAEEARDEDHRSHDIVVPSLGSRKF